MKAPLTQPPKGLHQLRPLKKTGLQPSPLKLLYMKKSEIFLPKVEATPDNMLFRFSLGQALYDEDETAAAIPHLKKCADSRNDWMLPRILLGKAMLQNGQDTEAKHILETALRLAVEQHHIDPAAELRSILADL